MKFAQYLSDTQTPEWKKAYIDYRGLKKRITAIRKAQQGLNFHVASTDSPDEMPTPPNAPRPSDAESYDYEQSLHADRNSYEQPPRPRISKRSDQPTTESELIRPTSTTPIPTTAAPQDRKLSFVGRRPSFALPSLRLITRKSFSSRLGTGQNSQRMINPLGALPLHELLTHLSPHEVSFFTMLDAQLDKVESFYLAREKEMVSRGRMLQIQLNELKDHRKLFLGAHTKVTWATAVTAKLKTKLRLHRTSETEIWPPPQIDEDFAELAKSKTADEATLVRFKSSGDHPAMKASSSRPQTASTTGKQREVEAGDSSDDAGKDDSRPQIIPLSADPDGYLYAKRKLKKAVLEHYRGLEMLHNYRVLNITGFRKALKKFEKVTKIPVQNQYMTEKVEKSAFASDKAVRNMMREMEEMYAAAFVRGDKKKALRRLRAGTSSKSHHFSTFRSGLLIGLAIPAVIDGLVKVFQEETRIAIPAWDILLYLYGVILVPVLFTLLVGVNLLVWSMSRINYVFIFELDVLTRLDHREYFETPSLLLAALCYAFWLSFSRIAAPAISPTVWPLVWLGFAFVTVFDPIPVLFKPSRFWLVRNTLKLFASGTRPVEFTDFWLGDQFCSLIFTLSNLYLFVCVYVDDFSPDWQKCGSTSRQWPIALVLATLPLFIRLVQSVKRYADSKLLTHLINGGKYGSGIIAYFFYFLWRHGGNKHGKVFALWCLTNACYSVYACSWDFLMDWSVLQKHSKNPLLRTELVYGNHIYVYYFAIVSNLLLRFIWVLYIPQRGPNMMVRTFIGGMLEMLRRIQWNFYRLENEHIGNMDQYRVTREVPLPYAFDDRNREDERDDDDHLKARR